MKTVAEFINKVLMIDRPVQETMKIYGSWAETYDQDSVATNWNGPAALVSSFLELQLSKEIKILDVCCGTGNVGQHLKDAGYKFIDGLDGCPQLLAKAKSRNVYDNLWQALIMPDQDLPTPQGTYDVALMSGAACPGHVSVEAYKDIVRVLKPGGIFGWIKEDSSFHSGSSEFENSHYEKVLQANIDNGIWMPLEGYFPKKVSNFTLDRAGEVFFCKALHE